jgi:flavin reductase (DIM6/NTAB) family NADH-FMN oxidoreductase RutF
MPANESGSSRDTLSVLWSPLLAVTTVHDGRANGQIAVSGLSASILPEAPRVLVALWKANLTHDLVLASRVFDLHLLPTAPDDALAAALDLIHTLGLRSGHDDPDKLASVAWSPGATGCPILAGALTYVEARVAATFDAGETTIFLGDVVGGARLREGTPLTWAAARERLPAAWLAAYDANQEKQRAEARRLRSLEPLS